MKFEITVLGSGASVPTKERNPTAQLINIQETYFLADCAEGTQLQLRNNKARLQRVRYILITHLHGDHFFGLPGLISTLHLLGRNLPLDIYGPPGLEKAVMGMVDLSRGQLKYPLVFHETDHKEPHVLIENDKFVISSFPLLHKLATTGFLFVEKEKKRPYKPSMGIKYDVPTYWIHRIKAGEDYVMEDGTVIPNKELTSDPKPPKSYAFCTDTAYFPKIADWVNNVDLMYHESSFLEAEKARAKATLHSTASDAAKIAALTNAKALLLGHFSARYYKMDAFINEAKEFFQNVTLASDGLVINL